jgi:hypothetical protein
MDMRNFHNVSETLMVLLQKMDEASMVRDDRPIVSLIHYVGKLFAKVLANQLAPHLEKMVHPSQSAFVKGRCIHDNFRLV